MRRTKEIRIARRLIERAELIDNHSAVLKCLFMVTYCVSPTVMWFEDYYIGKMHEKSIRYLSPTVDNAVRYCNKQGI
jgi:hypothetical protein